MYFVSLETTQSQKLFWDVFEPESLYFVKISLNLK
jgi:hypothetical protein